MQIKLSEYEIEDILFKSQNDYDERYRKEVLNDALDSGEKQYNEELLNKKFSFIKDYRLIYNFIQNSRYPYIIIDFDEFCKIEKYL